MKRLFTIAAILCTFVLASNAQNIRKLNIPQLKVFFGQYEQACRLSADSSKNAFRDIMLNDDVPLVYELSDEYIRLTSREYVSAFDTLYENHLIDSLVISDFKIRKIFKPFVNITYRKRIRWYNMYTSDPVLDPNAKVFLSDERYIMTLYYNENKQQYFIVRVDRDDYPFQGGVASSNFIPNQLVLRGGLGSSAFRPGLYESSRGNSAGAEILANYLLGGTGNLNYFLEFGLGFKRLNGVVSNEDFLFALHDQQDIDGDLYTLNIDGDVLTQRMDMTALQIPLRIKGSYYLNKVAVNAAVGAVVSLPMGNNTTLESFEAKYSGIYNIETGYGTNYDITLEDLPRYGFVDYNEENPVEVIDQITLLPSVWLSAGVGVSYPLNRSFSLGLDAEFLHSLTNPLKSEPVADLLIEDENNLAVSAPNLIKTDNSELTINDFGVSLGLTYHLKRPNIPYIKEIRRNDIPGVKKWDERSVCGYEKQLAKINTQKVKYKVFIEEDPDERSSVKKIEYSFCGGMYSNFSGGKLKVGKGKNIRMKAPVGKAKIADAFLRIHKPYSMDLYVDEAFMNDVNAVDEEYLDIPMSNIMDEGFVPVIYSKNLNPLSVYYCSAFVEAEENVNLRDFASQLGSIINSAPDDNDLLLYAACSELKPESIKGRANEKENQISGFVGGVLENNMKPFVDTDAFKDALGQVPYARRPVTFNFVIASTAYWEKSLNDVIVQFQFFEKVVENYEHITIKLYMPDSDLYLSQAIEEQLLNIFAGKLPPLLFDVEVIELSF